MRHWKITGAAVAVIGEVALQVSGFTCVPLAIFLAVVCVGLLGWSAWPLRKRIFIKQGGKKMFIVIGVCLIIAGVVLISLQVGLHKSSNSSGGNRTQLYVEKVVSLINYGWGLKVTNNGTETTNDCLGMLVMVEAVDPTTPSADTLNDVYANHTLHLDNDSIPSNGSVTLDVVYALYPFNSPQKGIYKLAWENEPSVAKAYFAYSLLVLISVTSRNTQPIYTLCYFDWKGIDDFGILKIVNNQLSTKPTTDECREMLAHYITEHPS